MKDEEAVIAVCDDEYVRGMELTAVGALAVGEQLMFLGLSASAPAGRLLLSCIYARPVLIRARMAIRSTRTLEVLHCHTLHNIFGDSFILPAWSQYVSTAPRTFRWMNGQSWWECIRRVVARTSARVTRFSQCIYISSFLRAKIYLFLSQRIR